HIDEREKQVATLEEQKHQELERLAELTKDEARQLILDRTEEGLTHEIAGRIREAERDIKERSTKIAKNLLAQAMQRLAGNFVLEQTVTTVHLPDD
ncbi:Rnase Y domain-containing protein, partial [Streptococcus suis]